MLTIGDVMSRDVFTLDPSTEADEAAWMLAVRGISGAPVVDHSGRLLGVLSRTDLADPERNPPGGERRTVGQLMTPGLLALQETDMAMSAIRLMVREEIHRVIVLDENGELAGIVTPTDILKTLVEGDPFAEARRPERPGEGYGTGPTTIH